MRQRDEASITEDNLVETIARLSGKWCLYLRWTAGTLFRLAASVESIAVVAEIRRAAPPLEAVDTKYLLYRDWAILFYDSENDLMQAYSLVVGDDGPTPSNPYDGPERVYAHACAPDGSLDIDNT